MKVSLFEITYKKKINFSWHSNLLRCTSTYSTVYSIYWPCIHSGNASFFFSISVLLQASFFVPLLFFSVHWHNLSPLIRHAWDRSQNPGFCPSLPPFHPFFCPWLSRLQGREYWFQLWAYIMVTIITLTLILGVRLLVWLHRWLVFMPSMLFTAIKGVILPKIVIVYSIWVSYFSKLPQNQEQMVNSKHCRSINSSPCLRWDWEQQSQTVNVRRISALYPINQRQNRAEPAMASNCGTLLFCHNIVLWNSPDASLWCDRDEYSGFRNQSRHVGRRPQLNLLSCISYVAVEVSDTFPYSSLRPCPFWDSSICFPSVSQSHQSFIGGNASQ